MAFFGGGGASVANMVGATSSTAGAAGLVPQPAAGEQGFSLCGDAKFSSMLLPSSGNFGTDYVGWINLTGDTQNFNNIGVLGNFLYRGGMFFPQGTYDRIALYVGTASSGKNAKVGIYETTERGKPGNLLVTGTISLAATGISEVSVSSFNLKSKYYYVAALIDSSGASIYFTTTPQTTPVSYSAISATASSANENEALFRFGWNSGNYSNGLPTNLATSGWTNYDGPIIFVRKS